MHDFITVGAPAPLQDAGAVALGLPDTYYEDLATRYQERRDRMIKMLDDSGFDYIVPQGRLLYDE